MKIARKLFIGMVSIVIPILIISGLFSIYTTQNEITKDVIDEIESVATLEKLRVSESISRNYERLDMITSRHQLKENLASYLESPNDADRDQINKILGDASSAINDISDLHILDSDGIVIFSTNENRLAKNYVDTPVFQNSHYSKTINVDSDDNEKFGLKVSGPIRLDNKFLGIMVIDTNLDLITGNLNHEILFGDSGELILSEIDENGNAKIITPLLNADHTTIIIPKTQLHDPIMHSLMQHQSTFSDHLDYQGNLVFASTKYIGETDWGLSVLVNKEDALSELQKIYWIFIYSIIASIAFSISISLFVANSITKPIRKLQAATKEISKGKLGEKAELSGSDEIKELAIDINKMQESIKDAQLKLLKNERFSAIGELSSRLAHDIRNPLSIISMGVGWWGQTHKSMDEKELKTLDMIDRATSKIKYMVENVLDYVRAKDPEYQETSLQKILAHGIKSIHAPENIKIFLPTNDMKINCDPNQIEVVFENLLTNSIQAIGDKSGSITISFLKDNDEVLIVIQDSGSGISEDVIPKIFDPLFTTKKEGTGLGLASCKSIIESHGGKISVSNNPTSFRIKLPLKISAQHFDSLTS
ncbi:MAG: ATP-binding protein [Nitrosopumilaceae archaeon]